MPGLPRSEGAASRRATWMTQERAKHAVQRLAARLAERAIPIVPIKGLALAHWIYADVADRPMVDADLLVPRFLFDEAASVVRDNGWNVFYLSRELGELCF